MHNRQLTKVRPFANAVPTDSHRFMRSLSKTAAQFSDDSTLHGLRNVMNSLRAPNRTSRQRLLRAVSLTIWIVTFVLGIIFAVVLMNLVWIKFQSTPTITTVESTNYPIWKMNFPAVTICNNNKVWAPAAVNITKKLMDQGVSQDRVHAFFVQLTKLVFFESLDDAFEDALTALANINYTIEHLMYEVMQPCDRLMDHCKWLGQEKSCSEMFRVATSDEGFCCSFNYQPPLDSAEVDTEEDYIQATSSDRPYRVSGAGPFVGIDILIHIDTDEYLAYAASYYGVTIMVHGSSTFPTSADKTVIGQPGNDVTVAVIPTVVVSEPGIRSLPLSQRNCYFEDEKNLNTTNRYTYDLCISECAVHFIYSTCFCLPFYYPEIHLRTNSGYNRQCTLRDVNCLHDNRHMFASLQPDGENVTRGMQCPHCLPSCSTEVLDTHTIIAKRSETNPLASRRNPGVNLTNYVTLRVHFKELSCVKYRRDVIMTWDGLFASFGGIFGLCLGGSVISMIELFFYFTVRLCSTYTGNDIEKASDPPSKASNRDRVSVLLGNDTKMRSVRAQLGTAMVRPAEHWDAHKPTKYSGFLE